MSVAPSPAPPLRDARIVVLGGGPSGLAVARLLQMRGVGALVLERDAGPHARTQGGSLDLTEDGGQHAVREMGLQDEFTALSRPHGQTLRVLDTAARTLLDIDQTDFEPSRPEIDRVTLRQMLLDALPAGTVRWSTTVSGITPLPGRGYRVELPDGTGFDADLVIGCDGIGSCARPLRTPVRPTYCGVTFIRGDIARPDPASFVSRRVGEGSMFAIGVNKAVLAQRNGDGSIHIYVALRTGADPSYSRGSAVQDEDMLLAELHAFLDGWSPEIHGILDQVDGGFSYWPLHTVPTHQEWSPHRGLTLVGDAAHVMPPFTGQGVNMALLDALELVDALTARPSDIDGAIASYEAAMLRRMAGVVAEANAAGDHLLSADGPAALLGDFGATA
ncbi:FAD-dependent oxidoreductase [Pseudonocardia sp. CA-142604]|uniref:FAD-dependent oxidoreductase n=1 Tax=Pseudonocardia sp. CA-142604 TaxID=3240024 RepID=UPI003D943A95